MVEARFGHELTLLAGGDVLAGGCHYGRGDYLRWRAPSATPGRWSASPRGRLAPIPGC
jgi:hypothetical protein